MTLHQSSISTSGMSALLLSKRLLAVVVGCLLLVCASWVGAMLRAQLPEAAEHAEGRPLQIVDPKRALIFEGNPATGDVRVLSVRNGISEIARLHEGQRQDIAALHIDTQGRVLTVESADGHYEYDTQTFRLLTQSPVMALGPDR